MADRAATLAQILTRCGGIFFCALSVFTPCLALTQEASPEIKLEPLPLGQDVPEAVEQPELSEGDRGPLVQQMQFYLQELGYLAAAGVTGTFDATTQAAVRSFQERQGLPPDGVMTKATWSGLLTLYRIEASGIAKTKDSEAVDIAPPKTNPDLESNADLGNLGQPDLPETHTESTAVNLEAFSHGTASPDPTPSEPSTSTPETTQAQVSAGAQAAGSNHQSDRRSWLRLGLLGAVSLGLIGSAIVQLLGLRKRSERTPHPVAQVAQLSTPDASLPITPTLVVSSQNDRSQIAPPTLGRSDTSPFPTKTIVTPSHPDPSNLTHSPGEITPHSSGVLQPLHQTGTLSNLGTPDKVEQLLAHLGSHNGALRHRAIWELGQQADSRAIQPLMELLPLSDSRQQSLILAALSEIGLKTFKPMKQALALSLDSQNPEVRKNAIRDLQRLYEMVMQSSQLLSYALNDPDPEVQETAQWAVDQLSRLHLSHGRHQQIKGD